MELTAHEARQADWPAAAGHRTASS